MNSDKCTLLIQAFTHDKVEVQINNGTNLVDVFSITNGEEKMVEMRTSDTITMHRVLKRIPKDHAEDK